MHLDHLFTTFTSIQFLSVQMAPRSSVNITCSGLELRAQNVLLRQTDGDHHKDMSVKLVQIQTDLVHQMAPRSNINRKVSGLGLRVQIVLLRQTGGNHHMHLQTKQKR